MKTTRKDYELFKAECERWIHTIGLYDWDIKFEWENSENDRAWVATDENTMIAILGLARDWEENVNNQDIKETAKHEIVELLVARFAALITQRTLAETEIDKERHTLVHRICHLI